MAHARFVCETRGDYDFKGWRLMRHPTFEPTLPEGVSHDLLEHYPSDRGRVMEEIRALGAFAFVQVDSGLLLERSRSSRTVPDMIAGTILNTISKSQWPHGKLPAITPAPKLARVSEQKRAMFASVEAFLRREWDDEMELVSRDLDDAEDFTYDNVIAPRWPHMLAALHEGYAWAACRYPSVDHAAYLYRGIDKLSQAFLAAAEEGDEMVVNYMLSSENVSASLYVGGHVYERLMFH